jgi:hypothetical protein
MHYITYYYLNSLSIADCNVIKNIPISTCIEEDTDKQVRTSTHHTHSCTLSVKHVNTANNANRAFSLYPARKISPCQNATDTNQFDAAFFPQKDNRRHCNIITRYGIKVRVHCNESGLNHTVFDERKIPTDWNTITVLEITAFYLIDNAIAWGGFAVRML